jgi:hypothetical protein
MKAKVQYGVYKSATVPYPDPDASSPQLPAIFP